MSVFSNLMLISLLILCVSSFNYYRLKRDQMCTTKAALLCVKDELIIIATIAESIARKSIEIETNIQQKKAFKTLNKYVDFEMNYTRSNLTISYYHNEFFRRNNIDQEFLNQLLFEAHNSMIYYYHSINDLLNLEVAYAANIDESFKKVQGNIRYEMICRYRSIMDVYSQKWKSFHDIGRIQFSKHYRLCPSCLHEVHSVVIARYLKEWMEQINAVIVNLDKKFFSINVF